MNKPSGYLINQTRYTESFCIYCGAIQFGTNHRSKLVSGRFVKKSVIVHCIDCVSVSHHTGEDHTSNLSTNMSISFYREEKA